MPRFTGTVLITGASAGIGAACARAFAEAGARLVLAARRFERIAELAAELRSAYGTDTHLLELDVRDAGVVSRVLEDLPAEWSAIDVLVNNAGLSRGLDKLHEAHLFDWEEMIDTNVKGLLYVTRAVLPGMVQRGRGHVVNIGSISGEEVYVGGSVYCATKAAVRTITTGLRLDLFGTPVRVTVVEPGAVETEFSAVRFRGDEERAGDVYEGYQPLTAEDVADAVLWAATRPPHVNVDQIYMKCTAQARAGMVYKVNG
jgi:3-hydroxy acid dehydrogenase / malonic semialdehyde reductase